MTKAEVIEFLKDYADNDEVITITDIESNPWDIYDEIMEEMDNPDPDDFDEYMAEREGLSDCAIRKAELIEAFDKYGEDNTNKVVKCLAQSRCDYPLDTVKYEWEVGGTTMC